MDRAHNLQNPKSTTNSRLLSGKIFPTNELNKNYKHSNNTKDDKFHPLDNAMQELLIQLQNEQLTFAKCKPHETKDLIPQQNKSCNDKDRLMTKTSDNEKSNFKDEGLMQDLQDTEPESWSWAASSGCGSIEKLQEKQSELQAQLDEFLQVKKKLEFKQKRILNNIHEDHGAGRSDTPESVDDDDELIEFQQIENELRITDLERQLNNIQEELRIRLYKRLSSNINTTSKQQHRNQPPLKQQSNRRGSHTDESSPSSSSCSDEPTTSSTSTDTTATSDDNYKAKADHSVDYTDGQESEKVVSKRKSEIRSHYSSLNSTTSSQTLYSTETMVNDGSIESYERIGQYSSNSSCKYTDTQAPSKIHPDLNNVVDNIHSYEVLTPSTSKESVGCSKGSPDSGSNSYPNYELSIATSKSISSSIHNTSTASSISSSNYRNSSANSDLERIEEDEEDGQDYYNDSDRFRTIYEEKLSPILQGNSRADGKYNFQKEYLNSSSEPKYHSSTAPINTNHSADSFTTEHQFNQSQLHILPNQNKQMTGSCHTYDGEGVELSNNSSFSEPKNCTGKLTNRPLTMYLPKPNEEIDLAEHIQALGHDLNIISSDVRLNSTSAQGYLWKSCSNNNKKWLKRYFHLDRSSKILSYYENEAHLVKKPSSPKNYIQFDEINDVYVDHKLSGIGEKNRSSKRKNYVFVLATIGRKYQLASSRAETMRAWIDILFTAAMANDYLLAIENEACEDLEAEER